MDSIDTELASRIRQDIILGAYKANERLSEAQLCQTHGVSRTPVRLALRILENDGLVKRNNGRGYSVNKIEVSDILQAVSVRGHLEALAARLMAQSPKRMTIVPILEDVTEKIDALIEVHNLDDYHLRQLQLQNAIFHKTILENCGNNFVNYTCNRISHLPMLEVGAMVFDKQVLATNEGRERSLFRLKLGNSQHRVIIEAILHGDAVRAEGMMREHSNTMIEYIEMFEKRNQALTISDLIGYSGIYLNQSSDGD